MKRRSQKQLTEASELQARRLRAQLETIQLRAAKSKMKGALNIHAGADVGRRNQDWWASNSSADLANIPDNQILTARTRQMVRDSWIASSMRLAFIRNTVGGNGIIVTPHAKDKNGKPLTALNRVAQALFKRWSDSKRCDVERRKTFPQMQRLAAGEHITVGEHLWMWNYTPPINKMMQPVGLQLQAFEPEQFDLRIISYEGREVRGGVEVDENGAPIAYHLYTRNPNDVLYRHAFFSQRVPADRMFFYCRQDRVLQTRGVTHFASIMQDIRDLNRWREAKLWRSFMEACVGMIVNQPAPGGGLGPANFFAPEPGNTGLTASGMSTVDFVPGMVARTVPGEELSAFAPPADTNYSPFVQMTVRSVGAGVGMSYGRVMRQTETNYSGARQDMLEDRKEDEIAHDDIISDLIQPTYEMWFNFAVTEGRFDGIEGFDEDEFYAERWRFVEAEYIAPPQTWIDPEKEANALAILLKNRLITREEIIALRGERIWNVVNKLADENKEFEGLGISLPENFDERDSVRKMVIAALQNRQGTIDSVVMNELDVNDMVGKSGIKNKNGVSQPMLPVVAPDGLLATGDPVKNKAGKIIGGGIQEPEPPQQPARPLANGRPNGHANGNSNGKKIPLPVAGTDAYQTQTPNLRGIFSPTCEPPPTVPNFRSSIDPVISCATCSYLQGEVCSKYQFVTQADKLCDDWRAVTLTENIGAPNTAKTFPPGPQPGQTDLETRFYPRADTLSPIPNQNATNSRTVGDGSIASLGTPDGKPTDAVVAVK